MKHFFGMKSAACKDSKITPALKCVLQVTLLQFRILPLNMRLAANSASRKDLHFFLHISLKCSGITGRATAVEFVQKSSTNPFPCRNWPRQGWFCSFRTCCSTNTSWKPQIHFCPSIPHRPCFFQNYWISAATNVSRSVYRYIASHVSVEP